MIINMTNHVLWLEPNRSLAVSETIANGDFKYNGVDLSNCDFDFQLYDTVVIAVPLKSHEPNPDDIVVDDSVDPSIKLDAGKIYVNVVVNNSNSGSNTNSNTNQADQSSSNSSSSDSNSTSDSSATSDSGVKNEITDVIIVSRPRNTVIAMIGAAIGISCFGIGYACSQDTKGPRRDSMNKEQSKKSSTDPEIVNEGVVHNDSGETR